MNQIFSFEKILTIVSAIVPTIATIAMSLFLYFNGRSLQRYQLREQKIKFMPYPVITKVNFVKSNPDAESYVQAKHCRFIYGNQIMDTSLQNSIFTDKVSEFESIEGQLIADCMEKRESVFFTFFDGYPCLMMNHVTNTESIIVDHHNVEIELTNYGSLINNIMVNSVNIFYEHGGSRCLKAPQSTKFSFIVNKDSSINILFDEASSNLQNSICFLPKNVYDQLPQQFDLMKYKLKENILQYSKLVFNCTFWNIYNDSYSYELILEKQGDYFVANSILKNEIF